MKKIEYIYENSLIFKKEILQINKKLKNEIEEMNLVSSNGYFNDRASINLPDDKNNLFIVKRIINKKLELNPKYIIVIGIGGSNLGTIAIQEAVLGKLYNFLNPDIKIFFIDNVDSDLLYDIISIIEPDLKKNENIIINVVSKSGGTTETIANFEILVNILKKYKEDYEKYVVVTTDKDSKLWNLSLDKGFETLEIPKKVGGRFSVFSPVGLFPLGLIGIDIDQLLKGARLMKSRCLNKNIIENPAALSASIIYLHRLKNIKINDLFIFNYDLESLGKWYRQLMAESIGKEYDKNKNRVFEGITPTVSIGSTDLHSMAQLYLGGPYDKFTTFVRIEKNRKKINIPDYHDYSNLVKNIQSKPLNYILNAILKGVKNAFKKGKRPYVEIILPDKSTLSIGQFMQFKEMEIMYLGYLLNVNPFDQPNVESYKMETRMILEK